MHPLRQLMYPSSLAFWGASNNPLKMGSIQMANILETGYRGEIYPIHPTESTVMGMPAYKSIADVGRPVDLAQLALPTRIVPEVLDECGRAGIRRAIVISGGFKEVEGSQGAELEKKILEIARSRGIRFLGPNCVGIFNSSCSFNSTTIANPAGGGKIALASQSGAYTGMIYPYLKAHGIKLSQTISVGNEADIDLTECLEYLGDEPEVEAIGLYVETIRRPREFIEVARRTVPKKPVVAIYVGGTEAGARSSRSHTGAVAGSDELYDGLFRQAGVIRADDMDEMIDFLWILSTQPLPPGGRMAVITNSGGPGASLSYHLEKAGLAAPLFSDKLAAKLDAVTGPLTYLRNPIDVTFETNTFIYKDLLEIVLDSGEVDGAFLYGLFGADDFMTNMRKRFPEQIAFAEAFDERFLSHLEELAAVPRTFGKPLVVMSFLGITSGTFKGLVENDVPVYPSASRAARAMRSLLDYRLASSRS
jgi:acyl-CoA synthetase (NDP forming)